ncbi:SprB repeat-containing protein [Runella sp. SP2]|uniref:SprB repeat-containing protein n=1 Tax=Runella sp. SP2 TaxID=2268026 RepID=UPI0013DE4A86|nr:SprB repeat-containing protein [Runella sp. SP2]
MKHHFYKAIALIVCLLALSVRGAYAQLVNSFTSESPAITCQPNGAETVVTITNGSTALTNATITIQLGVGIQMIPTSTQSLQGPAVVGTAVNLNAPNFTVASWPANTTLKFSFRKKAICAARAQKISGGGFQDVISIKNSSGTTLSILGTKTVNYDVIYASLSITSASTSPVSINPGQTATRSMTISNGSFGQLEEFLFADITSAGKFTYSDFRINPANTNISIPVSAISTSGDSVKVAFNKALIKFIGDGDEAFELNENFVLQYKITVNPCCPASTVTSKLIAQWGCDGQICQTATDNTPSVSVTSVQPTLTFSTRTTTPRCFDTPAKQTIVVANTTAYAATNVKVQFGTVNSTPNFDNTQQLYLAGPYSYRIKNFGTPQTTTPTQLATATNACAPANSPSRMEITIPTIAPGDTAFIDFYTISCCIATCNAAYTPRRWGYSGTYSGACATTTYTRTIQSGQSETYSANTFTLDSPLQIYDGQTFTMEVLSNSSSIPSNYNTAPAYLEYKYTIPDGFLFSGNAADFSFIDAGGVTRTPNFFNYTAGVLTVRFNAPISFSQTRSRTLIKLTAKCGTAGNKTISFQSQFITDPSCTTGCGALPPQCSSIVTELLCPGGACTHGMNWALYDIRRITTGSPDNNNDSSPDATGNLDLAKLDRFVVGDTLRAIYAGRVKTSATIPSFTYGYATASITNADEIADARYTVQIIRGANSYTCTNLAATVTGTTTKVFTYDFSTTTLISRSCLPAGFTFANGDSVVVTAKYIANNLTANSSVEEVLDITPEFYVANVVAPTAAQKYQCGTRKGRMRHFDIFNSTTTSNTNLNGCGSFTLVNNFNFSVGTSTSTTAGANIFTNEYRIFQVPANSKTLASPATYTINKVDISLTRSVGYNTTTTNITIPSSYYFYSGDTLIVNLQQLFVNGLLPYPEEGYSFRETLTLTPIGAAGYVNSSSSIRTFTQYRNLPPLSALTGVTVNSTTLNSTVSYNAPRLRLSTSQPTVNATSSTVSWDVVVSNTSTLADAPFPWLTVKSNNGTFILTQVQDITGTAVTISLNAGGIYQGNSTISRNGSRRYRVTGTTNFCGRDTIQVFTSWSCLGLSSGTTLGTVPFISDSLSLFYEVKPSQISATITKAAGPFDMCQPFEVEVRIVSGQPTSVNSILANLELPTNNGKIGLDYIAGSGTIEYPKGTTKRIFSTTGDNLILAAQSAQNSTLPFDLGVIDPTNFGTGKSLSGVGSAPNNEAVIRFKLQPNCDLLSGQPFGLRVYGKDPCGNAALGNSEYVQGFAVNIRGANTPYKTQVSLSLPSINACANVNYPIGVSVLNLGLSATNDSGLVEVQLPVGYLPVAGSVVCSSSFCPPNLNSYTVVNLPNGGKSLTWRVAAGMPIGGAMNFTFQVQVNASTSCNTEQVVAQTSLPFDVFCGTTLCPDFRVLTGLVSDTISVKKANFTYVSHSIAFTCSSATGQFKFKNTGAPVAAGNATTVELYQDKDKSGTYTAGDVLLQTYSTTQAIATNEIITLNGAIPYSEPIPCPLVVLVKGCACTTYQKNLGGDFKYENAGADAITCSNAPAQLGCSAGLVGYTYEWTPVGAALLSELSSTTVANPTVTVVNNGTTPIVRKYLLSTTHASGCVTTDEVQITINPAPVAYDATLEKCDDGDGRVDFTLTNANAMVTGGQANMQVAYFATRANAVANVSPLGSTRSAVNGDSVFVRVSRLNENCFSVGKVTLVVNPLPAASAAATNATCFGTATGSVNLTPTGGTPNYTFLWSNGATSEDISNVAAGNYSVVVTDAKGCTASTSATVGQPSQLIASIARTPISCNGLANGSLNLTVTGGTPNYTFAWSNGATTEDLSGLSTGVYSVTVRDANGCTVTQSDTITQPTVLQLSTTQVNVKCHGAATGQIDLTVTGGTAPYTYQWSNSATTQDVTGLSVATYTVTVTDKNGCQQSTQVSITQPPALASSMAVTNVKCYNENTGAIDLTVTGGTEPYTYVWDSGQTSQDIISLKAGTYRVTITDANGCVKRDSATVTQAPSFFIFGSQTNVKCFGEATGTITLDAVDGATPPYTYSWSNGATTRNLTNLVAGEYTVTVTDANGCTVKGSNQISQPAELVVGVTSNDVTCPNGSSGTLVSSVSGGVKPYRYEWKDASNVVIATTPNVYGLPVGSYTLTVIDSNNCVKQTASTTISQPPSLSAQYETTPVSCSNGNNGTITVNASGGTGALTYTWSDGGTGATRMGLVAGKYSVEISDANGCKIMVTDIEITQPSVLAASGVGIATKCYQGADGRIDLTVTGGTQPYTFGWSNGSSIEDPQNLAAGTYNVLVQDNKGCTVTASVTVSEPTPLDVTILPQNATCAGSSTGQANLTVTGGTGPYTYLWSNNATTEDVTGLAAGVYTVNITDANGCKTNGQTTIAQSDSLKALATTERVSCYNGNDGKVDLTVQGGTSPYTYLWSSGATSQDLTGVKAGSYLVVVKDANQCETTLSVSVTQPDSLHISFTKTDAQCRSKNDGKISVSVTGGVEPYQYAWSNGATTAQVQNLEAGSYTVTVTDSNLCQKQLTITIIEPDSLKIETLLTAVKCYGGADGKIDVSVFGGTQPYTYAWSNGATSQDILATKAGNYTVTVTDAQGCEKGVNVTLTQPDSLQISAVVQNVNCKNGTDGKINLTITGGTTPYQYIWSNGKTTKDIESLAVGTYSVTVQDANGCSAVFQTTLTEPDSLIVTYQAAPILCKGATTDVNVSVRGGKAPYTYQWAHGMTVEDLLAAKAGTYSLTVTDSNLCVKTLEFVLIEPDSLKLSATAQNVNCKSGATGSIDLSVTGGTMPYSYEWSNGAVVQDLANLSAGSYKVKVKDANGCSDSLTVVVSEPDPLKATYASSDVKCKSDNTGRIDVTVTGGTEPYSYDWSNGAVSQDITSLSGGVYTLTVTDKNGCSTDLRVVIGEPDSLKLSLSPENVTCKGLSSGTILSTVSGGTKPYQYSWSNGSTLPNVYGLPAGTYTLTVVDSNNCVVSASATLAEPAELAPNAEIKQVSCLGGSDGSIDFNVQGGTGTYTYSWSNGATTQDIANLKAGVYRLTVKDENNCSIDIDFTITQPNNPLSLTLTPTAPTCHDGENGKVTLTIAGGTTPYKVRWSNGAEMWDIADLKSGWYKVVVSDANGCTTTDSVQLANPALLSLVAKGDTVCEGDTVKLSATYDPTAQISWTGPVGYASGNPNPMIINSQLYQAGIYVATVTKGECFRTDTVQVVIHQRPSVMVIYAGCIPNSYEIRVQVSPNTQFSSDEGTVTYEGDNKYYIRNIPNNKIATFTATNQAGCSMSQKVDRTICDANQPSPCTNNPAGPNAVICEPTETHPLPKPTNSRYWIASASNPSSAFADTTGLVTGMTANGLYRFILVSPLDNCTDTVSITRNALPTYQLVASSPQCADDSVAAKGFIQLKNFAATSQYGLTVGNVYDVNQTPAPIPADGLILKNAGSATTDMTYTLRVYSETGCFVEEKIVLKKAPEPLVLVLTPQTVNCTTPQSGAINLEVSGGTSPYSYVWSNGAITQDLVSIAKGKYSVTVTDANGCVGKDSVEVTGPSLPTVVAVGDSVCVGETIQLLATVSDGAVISWTGPANFTASIANPTRLNAQLTQAGKYIVKVTDGYCEQSDTVEVVVNELPSLTVESTQCSLTSYSVRVKITPQSTLQSSLGTVTSEGNNTYLVSNIPIAQTASLTVKSASGCTFVKQVDRTLCDANPPQQCVDNPAGPNVTMCEPTLTYNLPKATNGRVWSVVGGNPSFTTIDSTGLVKGLNKTGTYRFVLTSTLENCVDTVSITRLAAPTFGVLLSPPTCAGDSAKKDGYLQITGFDPTTTFGLTVGTTYDETVVQQPIPANGRLMEAIANPTAAVTYVIRVMTTNGCFTEKKVVLQPVNCECPEIPCVPLQMQRKRRK